MLVVLVMAACGKSSSTPPSGSGSAATRGEASGSADIGSVGSAGSAAAESAAGATPSDAGRKSFPGDVPLQWRLTRSENGGRAFVVLGYPGGSLVLGHIDLYNSHDPQAEKSDSLGCEATWAMNHPADSILICGATEAGDHFAMRAQIRKGELVVTKTIAKRAESDYDFEKGEVLGKAKVTGTQLVADQVTVVPATAVSGRDEPCDSDANCKDGLRCKMFSGPENKMSPDRGPEYLCN